MRSIAVVPMDIHKKFSVATPMTGEGKVVKKTKIAHGDKDQMREFFRQFPEGTDVVMEATFNWPWIADLAKEAGLSPHLAHCGRVREMAKGMGKSDKKDAIFQGRLWLAGGDVFPEVYLAPPQVRDMRAVFRARLLLVKMRTMVKNKVHALTDKYGYRCELSDVFGKSGLEWLRSLEMSELDRLVLENHLSLIESMNVQISRVDEAIRKRACEDEDVRLLLSLTGVDVYSALLIRSEVGPITRFSNYKKLISWTGLAPSVHQSGSVEYTGRITKRGSRMLRWVMVEAARVAVQHDEKLGGFYERVRGRRGDQKAIVAVACKMLKIVWFMLSRREAYGGANRKRYGEKLKKIEM